MIDKVLILAAGQQARWVHPVHTKAKQLLMVGNETLIGRIIRQCRMLDYEPVVVTHNEDIKRAVDAECVEPSAKRWTCETLLTSPWGEHRTVVLLGDVLYTGVTIALILNSKAPLRVFGNENEIYALAFDAGEPANRMAGHLAHVVGFSEKEMLPRSGKLRKVYELLCGFEINSNKIEKQVLCYVRDHTMDVDTPQEYEDLKMHITRGILNE